MSTAYLSLGSNLGDRQQNLRDAMARVEDSYVTITGVSRLYESEPVGETESPVPPYLNCAIRVETTLGPEALLDHTQDVERAGKRLPTFRWGPRSIDVDIVLFDAISTETERLTLPHPRLKERAFVLRPLLDIEPGLKLPWGGCLADLLESEAVRTQILRVVSNEI